MRTLALLCLLAVSAFADDTEININFAGLLEGVGEHEHDHDDDIGAWDMECPDISYEAFAEALWMARDDDNDGLNFDMWGTIVNRAGRVCMIAYTGDTNTDQWVGSRVISAQKANTANLFNLPGFALSTANLYQPTQPGGSLYGLQESNPVNAAVAYAGNSEAYGGACDSDMPDPMCWQKPGGINVFGGGLGLYNSDWELVGGLGVSGDTSCADHLIAWKVRDLLEFDYVPNGLSPWPAQDNIIWEEDTGFSHPACNEDVYFQALSLGDTHPTAGSP